VLVAEDLDLDVAGPDDGLLEVDGVVGRRRPWLALRARERRLELVLAVDEAHAGGAAPAAP